MNDASHHDDISSVITDFASIRTYSEIDFFLESQLTTKLSLEFVDCFAIDDSPGAKHGAFDMNRALIEKQ
jgi:hypothetical protein